jgi:hypothetical protein
MIQCHKLKSIKQLFNATLKHTIPKMTYWKGTLTPKSTSDTQQTNKIINYRGVSIYRIQNEKMVETWHVVDGLPANL